MSAPDTGLKELGPTGWAPAVSASIFLLVLGGLAYMHPGILGKGARPTIDVLGPAILLVGLVPLAIALAFWMRSDLRFDAANDAVVARNVFRQRTGMILFLMSEAMFFFAFFWGFIRFAADPGLAGSATWPPLGIRPEDPFGMPLVGTIILLVSGVFAVGAHQAFLSGRRGLAAAALAVAIALGAVFLGIQVNEFLNAPFGYTAGSYASLFFLAVGFHGLHIFIGATLLLIALVRLLSGTFRPDHHFGFEASVWYWHFVDAVWLLLFLVFYWLPSVWITGA